MENLLARSKAIFTVFFLLISSTIFAQLTGIKTIPGDYATVSSAVATLNSAGVGPGGVIFNVAADYTETISATIALSVSGTAANPIIFQKDPSTSGANPLITAYTGGVATSASAVQDGIWRLAGSDHVTISAIDLRDNPANTNPATMEYGYALYKSGASNGCQYVTIQNCVITLNRSNNAAAAAPMTEGSAGIIIMNATAQAANAAITVTTADGANSHNKFYGNTIQNCNIGISLIGYAASSPFATVDSANDIGGGSIATGNNIINYGGASGAAYAAAGIRTLAQYNLNVSYNTINNNTGAGFNHPNILRGISVLTAKSAGSTVTFNTVTVKGGGTTQQVTGIENSSGSTAAGNTVNISNNIVTSCTYTTATTGNFYGIYNSGTPAILTISNNTVSNNSSSATSTATTTGTFYEIINSGAATAVTINGNTLTGNSTGSSIGTFASIYNSGSTPALNIKSNTLGGDSTATITGLHYSIYNSGSVTTTINIDSNNIGTVILPAIRFTGANAASQSFIYNSKGTSACALSISYNNFYNISYGITTAAANIYVINSYATRSQKISGNAFNNLNINISGNLTFISNNVIVSATGRQNVDSNAIKGTFTKSAGGTVTLFTSSAASIAGSVINNNNNNFSNITVSGATTIAGWINTDAGNSTKTIQNNTFSYWSGGTSPVTALSVNITGVNNITTGNTINNISSSGTITGISTGAGNDKIYSNNINTLISLGTLLTTVNGISVTLGTTKNIYQNTIYNLAGNNITTGTIRGIVISNGTGINAYQNTIYSLQGNSITTGSINGISISGGAANAYQNTIYSLQGNSITTGTINGISVTGGTTILLNRNKIYDLSSSATSITTGTVNGIQTSGTTASINITIQNNLIGDLRTPAASATDPIRGMSIISSGLTSAINVYNNTIYLNGTSSGTNFGSTGIYHVSSATATTAALDLRNNIISNVSIPNGSGLTVAFRRSTNVLTNYASTSNNNLFYAGLAAANRLIYFDVTYSDQLLSTFKARVSARDAQSVTEDLVASSIFISTSGSSASFLHLDSTKATQAESGGLIISSVATDFDGQARQGSTGYTGTGSAPDIGADEMGAMSSPALSGAYNVGEGQIFTSLTGTGGLFAGINSLGLGGNVVVTITSDLTEDGTNVLYQWSEKGTGNYTLTIQPDGPAIRVISGNVLAGMIRFNGAKRVIIDGSNGTTNNYLTFRNTNTAATTGTAFTFLNGATNNTIKFCNIEAYANATNGVMLFGTSTVAAGNSNNTISNCSINATVSGNSGNVGIYSSGTVGNENVNNLVTNNKIYNYRDRAVDIASTGSKSWNISGNSCYNGDVSAAAYLAGSTLHGIRILGGSGYTISNNYIGGNAGLASGAVAAYSSAGILSFQGILLTTSSATPASVITGNTVANISVSAVPTSTTAANVFIGIETNGSGVTIGGSTAGDGNTIGSNTVNGSIAITTATAASTYLSIIKGINCNSTGGSVSGNQVGGIDINNIGSSPAASTFNGIYINNATAPSQVNSNIIGSPVANSIRVLSSSTSTTTLVTGLAIGSSVASAVQMDGNLINNVSFLSAAVSTITPGGFVGISSAAAGAASISITNNIVSKDSIATYTTGLFYGIYNTGAASTVTINNNTLTGNSSNSVSGTYSAIYTSGLVTSAININNNNIGNSTTGAFTFNAINSGNHIFINNTGGTSASAVSISNNNFQGINYVAAGTGSNTYISNTGASISQTINSNTFTNLSINTAGSVTFISDNVALPASGIQNINNNSIVTKFIKKTGNAAVTLFTSNLNAGAGSIINNNSNNFSGITVPAGASVLGWINTDAGTSAKTLQNNTFLNWAGGVSTTVIAVNISGTGNITANIIDSISGAGTVTGISTGGNENVFANTISRLITSGGSAVTGIVVSGGTAKNIYKNKIYDLSGSNSASTVNGILISGGTTITVYNNMIGNLTASAANAADAIRGISITSATASSTINVYYNTVYLNATSSGTNFGSSGIFHTGNATSTTATLNLRNNSITNISAPKGTGITVAYRRSGTLQNYASTSNNNLFYAGSPSASRQIFNDGTNSDQTLASYKTRASQRDSVSVTEDITAKFLSTTGTSSVFLHMDTAVATALESGAINIATFTDDFDGQVRAGNAGYTGTSLSPDIGADEVFGIETTPPTIIYALLNNASSAANRSVTGIDITDRSGVNVAPGTKPRIYYKRFSDANVWLDNSPSTNGWKYTEATNSTSPFTFTINYSLLKGGATATAGVVQYFIVAQDVATTANVAIDSGTFAAAPSGVALTSSAFPIGGMINSYTVPFSGNYNVGSTELFTSLTKADGLFASINSTGLAGNVTFTITSDLTEDGANALSQWTESGAGNYTMIIKPNSATLKTISGNVAAGLIRLDGADRVTIDGSISGSGRYLSFKNTNTAGTTGTAFTFINGSVNNTIKYCDAQAYADATNGVILFGASAIAGGNSNNHIDNCTINATVSANTGGVGIYSAGTAGNENAADTISNNSIYNYSDRGLDVGSTGSTAWVISGNNFYNGSVTGSINYAASSTLHGIRVLGGSGYSIINNYIGGRGALASGANAMYSSTLGNVSYQGILMTTSNGSPASAIRGNTVASISISSVPTIAGATAFTGIETNGSGISIGGSVSADGNTIGSATSNGSITVTTATASAANTTNITGINCLSSGGVINNNRVSGVDISNIGALPAPSFFRGIYINSSTAPAQVNYNLIGSTSTSNSIRVLSSSTAPTTSLTGIGIGTAVNSAVQVNFNRVENINNLSTTSSGSFTGINNTATLSGAILTISNDTIQLVNTAANASTGSTVYSGIVSSSASTINNNIINSITLSSAGTNAQIAGINISGNYANSISGNIISNLSTASHKEITNVENGTPEASAIIGVLNSTTAVGQIISNNRFSGFNATSSAGFNVVVTGVGINAASSGNIFNNRFGTMTNLATGTAPALCNIVASAGSYNVYNNTLRISNLLNTNSIKIFGIVHASATNWNYYHNTVSVGGSTNGTAMRSAAFLLSVNSSPVLKNNIFFNIRTGTGRNYAISNLSSPPSNWLPTTSDYNDLYSINSGTVAEWGNNINKTFAQWQSLTGGDVHSINDAISFITSAYDLEPDSISNCAFDNAGIPITTPVIINTDINNKPRNITSPDLGAYEFSYTGFTIIAGNNSPVCAGDSVTLSVDPGKSISPNFVWRNPANVIISTLANPTLALTAGQYKVTVTDSTGCFVTDSTLVSIDQRPTATITSTTSLCDSGNINLSISVTGNGTINGLLSNGDAFSGTAPLITVPIQVTTTTSFSIISLSDSTCTAVPDDFPDTVTVTVTHKGDWLGITTNWHDPVNWCGGVLPTSSTDVTIPAGTLKMPLITDSVYCNNLLINTGDTLTTTSTGTLNIAGYLTNLGVYADNGTTNFNGTSGQQSFSGIATFNNLWLNNTTGLLVPVPLLIKNNLIISAGILNANNSDISVAGNWTNNASVAAFSPGTGTVTFRGTTGQSIGGVFVTNFGNLTISNTGNTVSLTVNTGISGNLSVTGGTFDLSTFTANRATTGGTLTVGNNSILKIGGTNTYPANYSTNTLIVASTVEYSGTNQVVANQSYGNLKLSSSVGAAVKTLPSAPLIVIGNFISTSGSGSSVSFTAASEITVNGNVSIGTSTTFNGGSYTHSISGNWINSGTFNGNSSTIIFTGLGTSVSGTGIQNFNNLAVAASGITFSSGSVTLTGNLATTGSGSFSQATGGTLIMSGANTTISGAGISLDNLTVSGIVTTSTSLIITGNLAVSGSFITGTGIITMSGASKTLSGTGTKNFGILSVTGSVTTDANFSISLNLAVSGSLSASAGTATFTGTSTLGGAANLFNATINGTSLQLSSGSVLGIANVLTVSSGILDAATSGPNTVNFNGTGAQNINNITYSNLVLSNGNTKTATGPITTAYDITIGTGTTFNSSSYTHSIYGNWINNGIFIPGTGTVQFLGSANSAISGVTTFNILTSNTTSSSTVLLLQSNVSVATVNMSKGIILTGSNILTITGTRNGNGYIYGNIRRTHAFTTGVSYAFEGPDNTITFSSVSGVTSVTVFVARGSISDFPFGGSISREYAINVPAGSYTATLRLHYEDDELNGNNESSMALWHYNGPAWATAGKTANSTVSNYVELSGLTNITNRWTASDNANLVQWNGSVSTDWNTAANWTVLAGSGSRPPSSTDIVDLGTIAFTNQPTISNDVTVKNIVFGSAQAVILTVGSGGSLTTLGDINGSWTTNTTHTINVGNQSLTVNGNLYLSDSTNGHAINLNIGAGTVTTSGSLREAGGANITFSGAGALDIIGDFTYASGTFTAGSGTVTYNGTQNQDIANVGYNNLIINKASGLAAINDTVNIAGDLLISSGELDNFSITNIAGNVTIDTGGIINNSSIFHVRGNWNNNGTYTGLGSSIYFDGTGTQNISASTFNNLNINKSSGTAVLTGEIVLKGDLIVTAGTLDFQTYNITRDVLGGTTNISDGATGIIGGNNGPVNFATKTIGVNSTIIYNGTGPQYISSEGIAFGNVIFRNGGSNAKLLITPAVIKGNLTIESGASLDGSSYTIALNGNWNNSGTFIPSTSDVILGGTSKSITGNTTFYKSSITGSYSVYSDIIYNNLFDIASTGSITSNTGISVIVNGDLTNRGVLITNGSGTFTGNVLQTLSLINATTLVQTVNFNGSVPPVLNSTSAPQFGFLNINNSGGINPSVGWTVLNAMTVGTGASFNGGMSTHTLYSNLTNNGTITSTGTLNFIPPAAATINFGSNFSSAGTVNIGGAGAMTLVGTPVSFYDLEISNTNIARITPSSDWNITNDFTIHTGSILNAGSHNYLVGDDILNNGGINCQTSTFILNGTGVQDIFGNSPFNNLTINKAAGTATLSSDATVGGVLNFVKGNIETGDNVLIQPSPGTVTGAGQNTGWLNGYLQKDVPGGSNVSTTFDIGGADYYTPATVLFASVLTGGNLTASTTSAEHPQIDFSGINKDLDVNRYWTLSNSGIVFTTAASTFNWAASDVDAGATTSNFKTSEYDGAVWGISTFASPLPNSIQATGLTSIGSFAIGEGNKTAIWTGAAGTSDWFTATNWDGGVPDTTVETLIPGTIVQGRFFPIIDTGTAMIDTITIESNATLLVTGATLKVKGTITNNGICDVTNGTLEMNGSSNQTIPANSLANNTLLNLVISNNVTLAGEDTITGVLSFGAANKTFTTAGFLTLKSTAGGTARVAEINPGNAITGAVKIERYISAHRAWRLLTSPVNADSAQTIHNAWQEGVNNNSINYQDNQNPAPGYGTHITMGNAFDSGFDAGVNNTSGLKGYNTGTGAWDALTSTKVSISKYPAYMLFVRGDRSTDLSLGVNAPRTPTILRSSGVLKTGNQGFTVAATGFTVISNPYASPMDLNNIAKSNSSNVQDNFYLWDPKIAGNSGVGGFVNFSWNGSSYDITPFTGDGISQFISSGFGFIAKSSDGETEGTLVVKEADKTASNSDDVNRPVNIAGVEKLVTNLYAVNTDGTSAVIDGVLNSYADVYSNAIDNDDAVKLGNFAENLSTLRNGTSLTVERRQPLTQSDTIFLNMKQMKVKSYKFEFVANNPIPGFLTGFLEDSYLSTSTPVSLDGTTTFDFNVTNAPGSWNANRFRIVFKPMHVLAATFISLKASQQNDAVEVQWKVENETNIKEYQVERSANGINFTTSAIVSPKHNNGGPTSYGSFDLNPVAGNNFYRIRSTAGDGQVRYSSVVKVSMRKNDEGIVLNTNVITDGIINFQLVNGSPGKYAVKLLNSLGQVNYTKQLTHAAGTSSQTIQLSALLAKGIYTLEFTKPGNKRIIKKVLIK